MLFRSTRPCRRPSTLSPRTLSPFSSNHSLLCAEVVTTEKNKKIQADNFFKMTRSATLRRTISKSSSFDRNFLSSRLRDYRALVWFLSRTSRYWWRHYHRASIELLVFLSGSLLRELGLASSGRHLPCKHCFYILPSCVQALPNWQR